jgi:hypothetical protein
MADFNFPPFSGKKTTYTDTGSGFVQDPPKQPQNAAEQLSEAANGYAFGLRDAITAEQALYSATRPRWYIIPRLTPQEEQAANQYRQEFKRYAEATAAGKSDAQKPVSPYPDQYSDRVAAFEAKVLEAAKAKQHFQGTASAIFTEYRDDYLPPSARIHAAGFKVLPQFQNLQNETPAQATARVGNQIERNVLAYFEAEALNPETGLPIKLKDAAKRFSDGRVSSIMPPEVHYDDSKLSTKPVVTMGTASTVAAQTPAAQQAVEAARTIVAPVNTPAPATDTAAPAVSSATPAAAASPPAVPAPAVAAALAAAPQPQPAAATAETKNTRNVAITIKPGEGLTQALRRDQKELIGEIKERLGSNAKDNDAAVVAALIVASKMGLRDAHVVQKGTINLEITSEEIDKAIEGVKKAMQQGNKSSPTQLAAAQPLVPHRIVGDLSNQR